MVKKRVHLKVLAIDPGDRRIGVAVSDPTGTIARALTTLRHVSRALDAASLADLAREEGVERIVVGKAGEDDQPQAQKAVRMVEALRGQTDLPIELWDESFTTVDAHATMLASGKKRRARREQIDAVAAAILLQSYLDAHPPESSSN